MRGRQPAGSVPVLLRMIETSAPDTVKYELKCATNYDPYTTNVHEITMKVDYAAIYKTLSNIYI